MGRFVRRPGGETQESLNLPSILCAPTGLPLSPRVIIPLTTALYTVLSGQHPWGLGALGHLTIVCSFHHPHSEFKGRLRRCGGTLPETSSGEKAGFKLSDFSQHLRFGISVLDGLFFFMGVEKMLESVPTLCNLEKRRGKKSLSFPEPHRFPGVSPINFKLWVEFKVFN